MGDQRSFAASFTAAVRYRQRAEPQAIIEKLASIYARNQVQEHLLERVAEMESVVKALPPAPSKQS